MLLGDVAVPDERLQTTTVGRALKMMLIPGRMSQTRTQRAGRNPPRDSNVRFYPLGLVALQAISHAFDSASRQSLIPLLIDRVHLSEAMALNWATFTVAFFTGPMLGGLLISLGGAPLGFIAVAVAFLMMLTALLRLGGSEDPAPQPVSIRGLTDDLRVGVVYIR